MVNYKKMRLKGWQPFGENFIKANLDIAMDNKKWKMEGNKNYTFEMRWELFYHLDRHHEKDVQTIETIGSIHCCSFWFGTRFQDNVIEGDAIQVVEAIQDEAEDLSNGDHLTSST